MGVSSALDRYFGISERGSDLRTEIKGGFLVFFAMSYIIAVNTKMMSDAHMDPDAAFTATILMSAIGSLLMGLYAKFPVAMAPGMGINAMFCYTAVLTMGFTWQEALVAVIISGALFFVATMSGIRRRVLDNIPFGIKAGITAGIGCFIAFIGLQNAGIIADSPSTLVSLGDMSDPAVLLGLFCIVVSVFLVAKKVSAGVLIGMIATAIMGVAIGVIDLPQSLFASPAAPPIGDFLDGIGPNLLSIKFLVLVIALSFVEFFDGSGTLMAVGKRGGFADDEGNVTCETALRVDAGIASLSGAVGCTPTTAYAESAVGVEAGARTGLVPVVVAILFMVSLWIAPLFGMIEYSCTVGAMVLVGAAMMSELKGADWSDTPTMITILMTVLMMILTYSITDGIAFGIILYCVTMMGAGRMREVSPVLYVLSVIFILYFVVCAISF
ncbi:NCS2 family permease [Candidatus Methanoprimaticola sp. MG2]|uniref:NCS2 family permease n=1 Tax=Candidatus Methanoprimaticola sp. MG2 TaxID=3228838 RepID=UPI0039C6AE13